MTLFSLLCSHDWFSALLNSVLLVSFSFVGFVFSPDFWFRFVWIGFDWFRLVTRDFVFNFVLHFTSTRFVGVFMLTCIIKLKRIKKSVSQIGGEFGVWRNHNIHDWPTMVINSQYEYVKPFIHKLKISFTQIWIRLNIGTIPNTCTPQTLP